MCYFIGMKNQISLSPPTRPHLLALLSPGMKLDIPLPYDAAFAAIAPIIRQHLPDEVEALPLFMKWLELRQTDLTLQQAVHLWANFFTLYIEDLPRMHRTWGHVGSNAPMAFSARSRMVLEIWLKKHYRPDNVAGNGGRVAVVV